MAGHLGDGHEAEKHLGEWTLSRRTRPKDIPRNGHLVENARVNGNKQYFECFN